MYWIKLTSATSDATIEANATDANQQHYTVQHGDKLKTQTLTADPKPRRIPTSWQSRYVEQDVLCFDWFDTTERRHSYIDPISILLSRGLTPCWTKRLLQVVV